MSRAPSLPTRPRPGGCVVGRRAGRRARRLAERLAGACPAAVLVLGVATAAAPAAGAQSSTRLELCLLGGFDACTTFLLTTRPAGTGTLVDVLVRHRANGAIGSALQGFGVRYAPSATTDAAELTPVVRARFGAPPVPDAVAWRARGLADALVVGDPSPLGAVTPAAVQYLDGCGPPLVGALVATPLATCGRGAYAFRLTTAATFEARRVPGFTVDVFAGLLDPLGVPTVVSCDVGAGTANRCVDLADLADPVVPFRATVEPTLAVVPEPASSALLAAGLTALAVLGAHRRRSPSSPALPTHTTARHVL